MLHCISRSLRVGTVQSTVEFRTDVFKLLFAGKGDIASNVRGHSAHRLQQWIFHSWLVSMLGCIFLRACERLCGLSIVLLVVWTCI